MTEVVLAMVGLTMPILVTSILVEEISFSSKGQVPIIFLPFQEPTPKFCSINLAANPTKLLVSFAIIQP